MSYFECLAAQRKNIIRIDPNGEFHDPFTKNKYPEVKIEYTSGRQARLAYELCEICGAKVCFSRRQPRKGNIINAVISEELAKEFHGKNDKSIYTGVSFDGIEIDS